MPDDTKRRRGLDAGVHRFRDYVAIYVGTGETTYMTPRQARAFARAIHATCRDVDTVSFTESKLGTKKIEMN